MRTLVFGDIHGRLIWEDIIKKEKDINKIVFLGDYVTTHESISDEQQLFNFENILTYKEDNPEKVILLRGNHDLWKFSWGDCTPRPSSWLKKKLLFNFNQFSRLSQWVYIQDNIIFSHAGVSQVWLDNNNLKLEDINKQEWSEIFGFTPNRYSDYYGESPTQPPTWIRPQILLYCGIPGYNQIVGHTPCISKIFSAKFTEFDRDLWLCDALEKRYYLIINSGIFTPTIYEQDDNKE